MRDFIIVLVTVSSAGEGERLAQALVQERIAACVNRVPGIQSVYRWEGKIEQAAEELLVIKTRTRFSKEGNSALRVLIETSRSSTRSCIR